VSDASLPSEVDVLVIGGGLAGLIATWQLRSVGLDAVAIEARNRLGGRVLTAEDDGAHCDLGPSWFWPGQPLITGLLERFEIPYFEQFADGAVLFERRDGVVERSDVVTPMAGARRIVGGVHRLIETIAEELEPFRRLLEHRARALSLDGDAVVVNVSGPSREVSVRARQVALAVPPRLAAALVFRPELPARTMTTLEATPTWMAGHAKFFAVYDEPLWRHSGLCGSAFSERGPLAEIHDASPHTGEVFSLFGFLGLDAVQRNQLGSAEIVRLARAQLTALFGEEASHPRRVHYQDWSTEAFTASVSDRTPQTRHPRYGLELEWGRDWNGKLELISSETSFVNGGLIEGALEAGLGYAHRLTGKSFAGSTQDAEPHTASMGWDWL
jgi:monoamine oxidase